MIKTINVLTTHLTSLTAYQFAVFKLIRYCFEETIGFDVKALSARSSVLRLIKPGDMIK